MYFIAGDIMLLDFVNEILGLYWDYHHIALILCCFYGFIWSKTFVIIEPSYLDYETFLFCYVLEWLKMAALD